MALRQCEKCSEMVDEAKAFCPGCGHAFVEEQKRQKSSEFEKLDNTVQLGQTMYNQILSDLGFNSPKPQGASDKRIEIVAPAVPGPVSATTQSPAATKPAPVAPAKAERPQGVKKPGRAKWVILAILGIALLLPPALISTVALVLQLLSRYR